MPFDGNTANDLFKAIKEDEVRIPREFSESLKDLLGKMLEKDQEKRISAQEALDHEWIKQTVEIEVENDAFNDVIRSLKKYDGKSKLKRAAINIMIKQISDEEFSKQRQIFNEMD